MIELIHVPKEEAIATAKIVIASLGENDPLSIKWIKAVRSFGGRWSPERKVFTFSV
jgi:hypothetical protein